MPYRAYFDGSGTHPNSSAVTLAVLGASEETWEVLELEWAATLRKHNIEALHMREFGAVPTKRMALTDLLSMLSHFREQLVAGTCTVVRQAHLVAREIEPIKSAEAICVDFCVTILQPQIGETMELYFDRNEPFQKEMDAVWRAVRKNAPPRSWPGLVRSIEKSDALTTVPLQATDLFAWAVNRLVSSGDNQWLAGGTLLAIPHFHRCYDSSNVILSVYDKNGVKVGAPPLPGLSVPLAQFRYWNCQ